MPLLSAGLDSASTLSIAKTLKLAARVFNMTIVVSLLQPEQEVFDTFDHVLVLAGGRVGLQAALTGLRVVISVRHSCIRG